jgi:hypothetical protein
MEKHYEEAIAQEFRGCVDNTFRRLEAEPTLKPFHEALLSKEAIFWSRFERSFSTSFGQRVIEKLSQIVALAYGAEEAVIGKRTDCPLTQDQLRAIDAHIYALRSGSLRPNWAEDLGRILNIKGGDGLVEQVISDLWYRRGGIEHFVSIKTVKPNIDQTAQAKRDLLKIKVAYPGCNVYFGLYYNPFGEKKSDYKWSFPFTIFDMHNDEVVLIGREYWETIGGDGAYDRILEIACAVGKETIEKVKAFARR